MTPSLNKLLLVILWLAVLALVGCQERPGAHTREVTRLQLGTKVSIMVWHDPNDPSGRTEAEEDAAMLAAFTEIARIEHLLSSHLPDSAITRINLAPRGEWQEIPQEATALVRAALALGQESAGKFDTGLWPLSRLWGFSLEPPPEAPPPAEAVAAWLTSHRALTEPIRLRQNDGKDEILLANESVGLDLGSIGKGYAVDQAIATLRQHGVVNAIVNAGGDLRAIGGKGEKPWRVGIRDPRGEPTSAIVAIELRGDRAVATSGDYERFFLFQGRRYHHIMDPMTGEPVQNGIASVTIVGPSTQITSVATTVFVLGSERGLALLERHPDLAGLLLMADSRHMQTANFTGLWLK